MPKKNEYDVIIVGGGPAGLFASYYLGKHTDLRVLLIEKGKNVPNRNCPIKDDLACVQCNPCNILLETKIRGMYVAGDGPGVAGNIVSAAASGLIPAKAIIENKI